MFNHSPIPAPQTAAPAADGIVIAAEQAADASLILELHERAFGPGRFARAAERVREEGAPDRAGEGGHDRTVSFTAKRNGALIGSVRMTPIVIAGVPGHLLGPLAVRSADTHRGVGGRLIAAACEAAKGKGRYTLLVGDAPYYARHGFAYVAGPVMPGPVDPKRLLVRWHGTAEPLSGPVRHAAVFRR